MSETDNMTLAREARGEHLRVGVHSDPMKYVEYHARNDVPALCDALEEAEGEIEEARAEWASSGRLLHEARTEITRLQRKIASLEREQERLWKLINAAEA